MMDYGLGNATPLDDTLALGGQFPLVPQRAGLMISRGMGRHIDRIASFFVLIFVRKGVLHIEEEGREFAVQEGQSLLLWPGRRHRGTQDYGENLQFYWLHFTLSRDQGRQTPLSIPQYATITRPDFVTELFRRYLDDQDTGFLQPIGATLYAWMILMEVSDTRTPLNTGAATALAGRAHVYITTHFHEKISASDVAEELGYNAQYLGRVFQKTYNQSLAEAIRRARINHAKAMLLETNQNVGQIARHSGFEDTTYFQRVFKQLEGITPLRFRRLHARLAVNN